MPSNVSYFVSPTGGCIVLNIQYAESLNVYTTQISIDRYAGSLTSTATNLYSGVAQLVYVDAGDSSPNYLDFSTPYYYKITDPLGTYTTGAITPSSQLNVVESYLDKLIFRLFSAGINAIVIPEGYNKIRVLEAMPLTFGSEATKFPFIVMNLDLEQQEETQIGQAVPSPTSSQYWTMPIVVYRRYSVSILSQNAEERNFYKDACKSVLYAAEITLNQIGDAVSYSFQVAQSQVSSGDKDPGFYLAEFMLDISGIYNVAMVSPIQFINTIQSNASSSGVTSTVVVTLP